MLVAWILTEAGAVMQVSEHCWGGSLLDFDFNCLESDPSFPSMTLTRTVALASKFDVFPVLCVCSLT